MDAMADAFLRVTDADRRTKILEVGIGTGRIAMKLLARELQIVGVDLSMAMMRELVRKIQGGGNRISLAQADAVRLPFPGESFDVVYAVHVFHLVPDWRAGLEEARRTLRRGGIFLLSHHYRAPDSPNRKIREKFRELARTRGCDPTRPGASDAQLRGELEKWNGRMETITVAKWTHSISPAQILDEVDARIYSDVWLVPRQVQRDITPALRAWAQSVFQELFRPVETAAEFTWLVARKS